MTATRSGVEPSLDDPTTTTRLDLEFPPADDPGRGLAVLPYGDEDEEDEDDDYAADDVPDSYDDEDDDFDDEEEEDEEEESDDDFDDDFIFDS